MLMIVIVLIILGLCFGSFVNAVVWRARQQELAKKPKATNNQQPTTNKEPKISSPFTLHPPPLSILTGRSQCVNCGHVLGGKDLIPVLSWIFLHGRCRYCQKAISIQYLVVELVALVIFVLSYIFWPTDLHQAGQVVLFITWLAASVGLLALAIYDLRWMLLPNKILYPTFFIALAGRLSYILFFSSDKTHSFWLLASSLLVASGFFWLIYEVSKGKWIGYGDVRLGLITGTLLASGAKSFIMIFLASIIGTLFVLPALWSGRQNLAAKVPFGPFLIVATAITVLFGQPLLNWYERLLT